MIVCEIKLVSAISRERDSELGTLVIDNITTAEQHVKNAGRRGNYRVRMYRKGALKRNDMDPRKMVCFARPTREGKVFDHARLAEPVQSLVAKALKEMDYG